MSSQVTKDEQAQRRGLDGRLDRYFGYGALGSNLRVEVLAGLTTFITMAYIVFVNPSVLSEAGVPERAVFTATCLAAALGTLVMGLWARYPIAMAPGLGLNAFFAFTVVLSMGIEWQVALAGTLVSGFLFFLLAITGARAALIDAIPLQMKYAMAAGIGLFIAFIGLTDAGLVVADEATFVTLGDLTASTTLLSVFGIIATALFVVRGIRGGVFWGLVVTAVVGVATQVVPTPDAVVGSVPSLAPTFGEAFVNLPELLTGQMVIVVFTMLFVDLFDTTGTIIAVSNQAGLLNEEGQLPRAREALSSDAIATMGGAAMGTSTTTSYIESAAGVGAGGRSGLTAVVTAILFLLALPFSPLLAVVTSAVTAPALIIVGMLMARGLGSIAWDRTEYALPAFVTVIAMPLTFSIANGLALGLTLFPLLMVARGRAREVHPVMYGLLVVFLIYFVWLLD